MVGILHLSMKMNTVSQQIDLTEMLSTPVNHPMTSSIILSPLAHYHAQLRLGHLEYQYSQEARRAVFFPRLVCPFTGSTTLEWRRSKGLGTVYASTVIYPRDGTPYNVALIDVDEGFRMMSRVDNLDPVSVRIGLRVGFHVIEGTANADPIPVFTPLEELSTEAPEGGIQ